MEIFLGIGIEEVHLEEDPARWDPLTGNVDYNRSGFPLVEIVTKPDFKSAEEVKHWLKTLLTTLSYIRAVDKKAGIKSDVNVSIAPRYVRTEVKNVNSISNIVKAINYEEQRQRREHKNIQQTRTYDDNSGETIFMRSKETAQDYMFIPEPDLPVIKVDEGLVKEIASKLPEKPSEKYKKYLCLGIDEVDAKTISSELVLAELFEKVIKEINPVFASRWFRRDVIAAINDNNMDYDDVNIDVSYLIDWFLLLEKKEVSPVVFKRIVIKVYQGEF